MPQFSDAQLTTEAQVIRDETTELANTKTRVYDILKNIIDSKPNITDIGGGDVTTAMFRRARTVNSADGLVQNDDNGLVIFNSATPFNFTLDQLTANLAGLQTTKVSFINIGAGAVTFINGAGVTLAGSAVLSGAIGTNYPGAVVYYDTATTPRIVNSGPNDLALVTTSTTGDITLDFNNEKERMFVGSASFTAAKAVSLSNNGNALLFTLVVTITNVSGVLTFPSDFTMPATDVRWNDGAKTFTVPSGATGKYEFSASFDGTDWNMKATNQYA